MYNRYLKANSIRLLHSGNQFFEVIIDLIRNAKSTIHIQTYIFSDDNIGKEILQELKFASQRNVQVWILLDGYGSKELPLKVINEITNSKIHFRFFGSFLSNENISIKRRLHHKIIVIDEYYLVTGGININDKYRGSITKKAWLDYAVLIEGECVQRVHQLCNHIFDKDFSIYKILDEDPFVIQGDNLVRFSSQDWLKRKYQIYRNYRKAILTSKDSITIISSYFLPGFLFLRRLKKASLRGVKIRIVLGTRSDIPFFYTAQRYLYEYLLKHKIEIYEYHESVIHAKIAIVDNNWCTIGSYNLNNLSKYSSIEFNVDIKDSKFVSLFKQETDLLINNYCNQVYINDLGNKANILAKAIRYLSYSIYKIFFGKTI